MKKLDYKYTYVFMVEIFLLPLTAARVGQVSDGLINLVNINGKINELQNFSSNVHTEKCTETHTHTQLLMMRDENTTAGCHGKSVGFK